MLGQILGMEALDEYNNAGALLGLNDENNELVGEIVNALQKMNPIQRAKTVNKITAPAMPSKGSRAEMEKHFGELPEHIKEGLKKGELRLADTIIYSIKKVGSKTIKMFETQDDKEIGLRNVSNAKLPKNQCLLVSGIILLAGIAADETKDKIMATKFDFVEEFPAIINGEFSLKSNKRQIVPDTGNRVFATKNFTLVQAGYYKLSNPRLISDDVLIEMTIELGTMEGLDKNTHIWAGLHGTITTP